jgi:hypothetical protein
MGNQCGYRSAWPTKLATNSEITLQALRIFQRIIDEMRATWQEMIAGNINS